MQIVCCEHRGDPFLGGVCGYKLIVTTLYKNSAMAGFCGLFVFVVTELLCFGGFYWFFYR